MLGRKTQAWFESRVLELWTTTRLPLTRANLCAMTGVERARAERYLDALVSAGVLEVDSDDEGELLWVVRGARRPARGLDTVDQIATRERLDRGAVGPGAGATASALALALASKEPARKSVIASGALSLFSGPLGWLYAAPMREAIPAAAVYVLICSVVPNLLLVYLLGPICALSGFLGMVYAASYNRNGARMPLVVSERPALPGKRR